MIITVASFKGGVAKTTSAIHLAAYLQKRGPTLLIDGDPNRSASGWAKRGSLPFKVIDERQAARFARDFAHVIIDTEARPSEEDLKALADGCDLLIIPTTPDALSLDAPIDGSDDGVTLAELLADNEIPPDEAGAIDPRHARIDIGRAMARLTPVQRRLCQMLGEEGLSVKEAAERLRIPRGTLYEEIKRIRKVFADHGLGDYLKE